MKALRIVVGIVSVAAMSLLFSASSPQSICAQGTCPGGCSDSGNAPCHPYTCYYRWIAIE